MSGRKYILFLQSLVWPLQTLNDRFVAFAKEKQIEAAMTSQVFYFEWYLNRKFGRYLANPDQKIFIKESSYVGVNLYFEDADYSKPFTVWFEGEQVITSDAEENPQLMYLKSEEKAINKVSFMVCVPQVNISEHEFVYMLSYTVSNYKLAGKTYLIKIDDKEITPNSQAR